MIKHAIGLLVLSLLTVAGCPQPVPQQPELPKGSRIPPGVYTEQIEIMVIVDQPEGRIEESDSLPFTVVIDENGRFLDANGVPFVAGELYFQDSGLLTFENLAQSITAVDYQIVLRFHMQATADLGDETAELSGFQTDTLSFDADTGILRFVRFQGYGGTAPSGSALTVRVQAEAELRSG